MTKKMSPNRLIDRDGAALIIIDVQEKLLPKIVNKEKIVKNIINLINFSKICDIPIILTEQYPKGLGPTISEIKNILSDVPIIEKTSFSCFGVQKFKDTLEKMKISTLILTGIEAHVCVAQTALDALDNYRVCVISDAVSSRTQENVQIGLERIKENGGIISSTEMVMFEILRNANTKEFKESLPLLK